MASFERLTDRERLEVDPMRLRIVELPAAGTLTDLDRRSPSVVPLEELVVLNHLDPATSLPAGSLVKRVVGGP
jgi:predicted Zn-dependent protease